MNNYIVWVFYQYEGWHVHSTHETKVEAVRFIRSELESGTSPEDIHLTGDLNWSVNLNGTTVSYQRGNWRG